MRSTLILFLICFIGFSGKALTAFSPRDTLSDDMAAIPAILRTNDYKEKLGLISKINESDFIAILKSGSEKFELDTIITKAWSDELQSVENNLRYNYDFENGGSRVVVKIYQWNRKENGWRIVDQVIYDFNDNGYLIQARFNHYVTHLYLTYAKIDYNYQDHLLIDETFYEKMDEEDEWEKLEQISYDYDSLNFLSGVFVKEWDDYDHVWVIKRRTDYTYDQTGNVVIEAVFDFDAYTSVWSQKNKTEYSYNTNNKLIRKVDYLPGPENTLLQDENLEIFYDSNSIQTHEIYAVWDYDFNTWLPLVKKEFHSDVKDMLYKISEYKWNPENQNWQLNKITDFLSHKNLHEEDILFWQFIEIHYPLYVYDLMVCDQIIEYGWLESEWTISGEITYIFTPRMMVNLIQDLNKKVRIYPNPCLDYLTLQFENYENVQCYIYDMQGRNLISTEVFNQNKVDLSTLKQGIYLIHILQNGNLVFNDRISKL